MSKDFLIGLRSDPRWHQIMQEVEAMRPVVPQYDWRTDNKNEVTAKMLQQQGFDLAILKLKQ